LFTAGALNQALYQLFRSGLKYAPGPSELWKTVAEVQALRVARGEDDLDLVCSKHVWAQPAPYDEDRRQTCVLCGETGIIVECEHHFQNGRCVYCPGSSNAA